MTGIQIWTGLPGAKRRERAIEEALKVSRAGSEVWWLVDGLRRVETVEEALLEAARGATAGITVLPAGKLGGRILTSTGLSQLTIDNDTSELLLREIIAEITRKNTDKAGNHALNVDTAGWTVKIAQLVRRMKLSGFRKNSLSSRYRWIREVLDRFEERLAAAGLLHEADLPGAAIEALGRADFQPPGLFIVDRLGPQLPVPEKMVHRLADKTPAVIVMVDHVDDAGAALEPSRKDLARWREHPDVQELNFTPPEMHTALARNLFASGKAQVEKQTVPFREVMLLHQPDMVSEVREVARRISHLVHEGLRSEEEIAVAATKLEDYAGLIREIFPEYGIHADLRLGPRLSTNPVAMLAERLFELRAEGASRENVMDLLLNPLVSWGKLLATDEGVLRFDSFARMARIREGRKQVRESWIIPLRKLAGKLKNKQQVDWLLAALKEFERLAKLLFSLPDPCRVDDAVGWLERMFDSLKVNESIHRRARENPGLVERDVHARGQIKVVIKSVAEALRVAGREKWSVDRFAKLISFSIGNSRLRPRLQTRGGVRVTGPLDLRGQRTRELFLLGFTDEHWPRQPERDLFSPFSRDWPDGIDRFAESRALTLEALLEADNLWISLPALPVGGNRGLESRYLEEMKEAGIVFITPGPIEEIVYSQRDVLVKAGKMLARCDTVRRGLDLLASAQMSGPSPAESAPWRKALEAVRVELIRSDPASLTRFEGMIDDEAVLETIRERALGTPLSAHRLDTYAKCPMKFLFDIVLKIEELEDVRDDPDGRERGELLHRVLAATVKQLGVERNGAPSLSENQEQVAETMLKAVEQISREFPYQDLFWEHHLYRLTSGLKNPNEPRGVLRGMLEFETKNKKNLMLGERIHFVEVGFGNGRDNADKLFDDPLEIEYDGKKVRLQGKIDRVSLHPEKGWRVWDYKTGSSTNLRKKNDIQRGLGFQLPLYVFALLYYLDQERGEARNDEAEKDFDFAAYYMVNGPSTSGKWDRKNHGKFEETIRKNIVSIYNAVAAGCFHTPLTLDGKRCVMDEEYNYCPFRYICRGGRQLFEERGRYLEMNKLAAVYFP